MTRDKRQTTAWKRVFVGEAHVREWRKHGFEYTLDEEVEIQ